MGGVRDQQQVAQALSCRGIDLIEGHPLREEYVQSQHDAIDALARWMREADAGITAADAERISLHALSTLKGLRAQWALMTERIDLAAEASAALEKAFHPRDGR